MLCLNLRLRPTKVGSATCISSLIPLYSTHILIYSTCFYIFHNNPYTLLLWPAPSSIFLYYYLLNNRLILGYYIPSLFLRSTCPNHLNQFSFIFPAIFTTPKFPLTHPSKHFCLYNSFLISFFINCPILRFIHHCLLHNNFIIFLFVFNCTFLSHNTLVTSRNFIQPHLILLAIFSTISP